MKKMEMLKKLRFGAQVAEDEINELANYFVETHQWDQISAGKIDIVRGEKGAGKSAIYTLLLKQAEDFFQKNILLVAAERLRGATVFKDLVSDPPTSEQEFVWLWKLYIITIIAQKMREFDISGSDARKLYGALEEAKLLEPELDLQGLLRVAQRLVRKLMSANLEYGVEIDANTGLPGTYFGKLLLKEPTLDLKTSGFNSIDMLFKYANSALESHKYSIWVLLDRLDVAFAESHDLEANALRALLRVYGDLKAFDSIFLKIFLREDIWKRIFESGFREASHINNYVLLNWDHSALLNLLIRRLLSNAVLASELNVNPEEVLGNSSSQEELFKKLFPKQVEQGPQKPTTFNWMVSRCADATQKTAPRELIHLLNSLLEKEIARLEKGGTATPDIQLFDRSVFKPALITVSKTRINQNLYAEHPDLRKFLVALENEKTAQKVETLAKIWGIEQPEAVKIADDLVEIGFFEKRGSRDQPIYWVPFLYRDGLEMVQGSAEEGDVDE